MLHIFLAPFAKFCPDCGAWPERQKRKKNRVVSGEFEDGTDGPSIPVVLGQAGGGSFRAEILFCRTQTYRIGRQSSDGVEWNYCSRGLLGHLGTAYPIPKTIQKRYTKRYFRFRFARHPPFRTSMTSLLLSLLALACAGGQLCRCLCWRCWWCLCCSGAWCRCWGVSVWCLVLLVWCLVSLVVRRWSCYPCCCCCLELVPLLLLLLVMCSCKRK